MYLEWVVVKMYSIARTETNLTVALVHVSSEASLSALQDLGIVLVQRSGCLHLLGDGLVQLDPDLVGLFRVCEGIHHCFPRGNKILRRIRIETEANLARHGGTWRRESGVWSIGFGGYTHVSPVFPTWSVSASTTSAST